MLKPEAAVGEEFRRFEDEASLLAQIHHPNVVTIFDFGRDEATGCFYYTMSFIDGPTLKNRLAEEGHLAVEEALRIFVDILDGLETIHRRRIVHRDIKPGNVLIDPDGRPYLGDLGIARVQTERSKTRTGVAVGTALYMSPEQARGKPVDTRSDVFSVGLTLYEVLTGQVVYDHVDSVDSTSGMDVLMYIGGLVHQKREFEVIFPQQPELPRRIKEIIQRACRLNVGDRFQTAAEMRAELLDVLRAPPPPPALGSLLQRYKVPLAGAAGLLALGVSASIVWAVVQGGRLEREAEQLFQQALALDGEIDGVLDRAADLGVPEELGKRVADLVAQADAYTTEGEQEKLEEYFESAKRNFEKAIGGYGQACDALRGSFLTGRADGAAAEVETRVAALREAGAAEHAAAPWTELQGLLPGLAAAPGEGCSGARAQLARLDASVSATAAIALVDQELGAAWPRLAEEARQQALTARRRAEVDAAGAPEQDAALRDGKRLLVRGESMQKSGDFRAARAAFDEATGRFAEAQRIAPAARGRQETHALADEVRQQGTLLGGVARTISAGDRLYDEARWPEAAAAYAEAVERLRGMRAEQMLRADATAERDQAKTALERAAAEGAETSAPESWAAARSAFDEATRAFESGDYTAAEDGFRKAREAFAGALDAAIGAQQAAAAAALEVEAESKRVLGARAGCDALGSEEARASCAAGRESQQRASTALEARDAARAQSELASALEAWRAAGAKEEEWQRTRPQPPALVKRSPERAQVEGKRNELRTFHVEAQDPNGDALRYSWTVAGQAQSETGSTLQVRIEGNVDVSVRVEDGSGGAFTETWSVQVGNQPPRLAVTPEGAELVVQVGESLHFRAVARDADGDPVRTLFRLDGREVAGGASWVFDAREPGAHKLEIVAADAAGAQSRELRRIVVPAASGAEPAGADGWRSAVRHALDEYEAALEAGDIERLGRVLSMGPNSPVRAFYERKFSRGEQLSVQIDVKGDIRGNGRVASVDFDQVEASGTEGRPRVYQYRVSMVRQPDGNWRIERRERRR
jgi:hypothetical protein